MKCLFCGKEWKCVDGFAWAQEHESECPLTTYFRVDLEKLNAAIEAARKPKDGTKCKRYPRCPAKFNRVHIEDDPRPMCPCAAFEE